MNSNILDKFIVPITKKQLKKSLFRLSNRLIEYIFEFLSQQEQLMLALSSKRIYYIYFSDTSYYLVKNSLNRFFSINIEYFIDCGDDADYLSEKNKKDLLIAKSSPNKQNYSYINYKFNQIQDNFKNLQNQLNYIKTKTDQNLHITTADLQKFNEIQNQIQQQQNQNQHENLEILNNSENNLKNLIQTQKFNDFLPEILAIMREPDLPILKLRRENIGQHCQTWLQNQLAEILYEGGSSVHGFGFEDDNIILETAQFIKEHRNLLKQQVSEHLSLSEQNRKDFLQSRWYINKTYDVQNDKMHKKSIKTSPLNSEYHSSNNNILNKENCQEELQKLDLQLQLCKNSALQLPSQQQFSSSSQIYQQKDLKYDTFKENSDNNLYGSLNHIQSNHSVFKGEKLNVQISELEEENDDENFELPGLELKKNDSQAVSVNGISNSQINNLIRQGDIDISLNQKKINEKPILLQMYLNIYYIIETQVELISEYLNEHQETNLNAFDLLSEYILKWGVFVASLHKLEDDLKPFFEIFNESYEESFPEYPSFPKISVWRMMGKLWNQQIFSQNQLQNDMFNCFLKILTSRRKENLSFQLNQSQVEEKLQKAYYMPSQLDSISLLMQTSFTKSKKFSFKQKQVKQKNFDIDHAYFSKNSYQVDSILTNFVESILDISLNEINVHYLGHNHLPAEKPYLELEEIILENCKEFYEFQYQSLFQSEKLSTFLQFLEGDMKYLSKIFKERTLHQIKKIQFDFWKQKYDQKLTIYLQDSINGTLEENNQFAQQCHNDNQLKLKQTSPTIRQQDQIKHLKQKFINLYYNIKEENVKNLSQEQLEIQAEDIAKNYILKGLFYEDYILDQKIDAQQEKYENYKSDQDQEIEDLNKWRKIPMTLENLETQFYSLNGKISLQLLESLVQDKKKQEEKKSHDFDSDSDTGKYSEYHSSQGEKTRRRNSTINSQKTKKSQNPFKSKKNLNLNLDLDPSLLSDSDHEFDLDLQLYDPIKVQSITQLQKIDSPNNQNNFINNILNDNLNNPDNLNYNNLNNNNINNIEEGKFEDFNEDEDLDLMQPELAKIKSCIPILSNKVSSESQQYQDYKMRKNVKFNEVKNQVEIDYKMQKMSQISELPKLQKQSSSILKNYNTNKNKFNAYSDIKTNYNKNNDSDGYPQQPFQINQFQTFENLNTQNIENQNLQNQSENENEDSCSELDLPDLTGPFLQKTISKREDNIYDSLKNFNQQQNKNQNQLNNNQKNDDNKSILTHTLQQQQYQQQVFNKDEELDLLEPPQLSYKQSSTIQEENEEQNKKVQKDGFQIQSQNLQINKNQLQYPNLQLINNTSEVQFPKFAHKSIQNSEEMKNSINSQQNNNNSNNNNHCNFLNFQNNNNNINLKQVKNTQFESYDSTECSEFLGSNLSQNYSNNENQSNNTFSQGIFDSGRITQKMVQSFNLDVSKIKSDSQSNILSNINNSNSNYNNSHFNNLVQTNLQNSKSNRNSNNNNVSNYINNGNLMSNIAGVQIKEEINKE